MEHTSIDRIKLLHPKLRDEAITAYNEAVQATSNGVHPFITQSLRTFAESDKLYQQGRTTKGSIVTNARAGSSYHNYGLAFDFVLMKDDKMVWEVNEDWMIVVNIFKKYGWSWGGDWHSLKDFPHLEKTFGYDWKDLIVKYKSKDFIKDTQYVNI